MNQVVYRKDVASCSACGAKQGISCRRATCPQIQVVGGTVIQKLPIVSALSPIRAGMDPMAVDVHSHYQGATLHDNWFILFPHASDKIWDNRAKHLILVDRPAGTRFKIELVK